MTRTKIIATLGPASQADETISGLMKAGADLFRLNMSHGDASWHRKMIKKIRHLSVPRGLTPAGVIGDLAGPKIRVGELAGGQVELRTGAAVTLVTGGQGGGADVIHVGYPALGKDMKPGGKVLIDDGMIELRVVSAKPGEVRCRVVKGGVLKEHKGVNFPGLPLDLPSLTEKDLKDLSTLLEAGADYIALSFVREASDVHKLRERIRKAGYDTPVIAKIERPEAVKNIRDIALASDGIMVARGDLGVEMPPEAVPPLQKRIIRLCHELRKPVITATQMLESMVRNPRPTRAEASDVAGAVFDGTDALMLSEETAAGMYPLAAVVMMNRIAAEAEKHLNGEAPLMRSAGEAEAIAGSACGLAESIRAKAIICFTRSGMTALLISKHRPKTAVIAATPDEQVMRRMRLYYGVLPLMARLRRSTDGMIKEVESAALSRGLVREGDTVILTIGVPATAKTSTNLLKVHRVGEGFGK